MRSLLTKGDAVFTLQLFELQDAGIVDWNDQSWFWEGCDYDSESKTNNQHDRICKMFDLKYRYREISLVPFKRWKTALLYKIQYELVPKYKPLYEELSSGIKPLAVSDEYEKRRDIESGYPETMLSGNSVYLTSGQDHEHEKIINGDTIDQMSKFEQQAKSIDQMFIDELEIMFIPLMTSTINYF